MPEKDYSHVPLARKLGIREGATVVLDGAPEGIESVLAPLPDGVQLRRRPGRPGEADVVLCFRAAAAGLDTLVARLAAQLTPAGGLWICYPKRTATVATDVTFDAVQRAGLDAGLVDNKSCSIDATWSAVRFVVRLRDRASPRR